MRVGVRVKVRVGVALRAGGGGESPLASPRCSTEPDEPFIEPLLHQVGYCAEPGGVPPTTSNGALPLYLGWGWGQGQGWCEGPGGRGERQGRGEGRGAMGRGEGRGFRRGWSVVG